MDSRKLLFARFLPLALLCTPCAAFSVQGAAPSVPVECGALVDAGELMPGEEKYFSFSGDPGDKIYLRTESLGTGYIRMDILDPLGFPAPVDWRFAFIYPAVSGRHSIKLTNLGAVVQGMRFQLDWLAPDSKHCGDRLECGSSELGAVSHPFPKVYHFEGEAGDKVICSVTPITNASFGFHPVIYGPDGSATAVYPNSDVTTLPADGGYSLLVWDGEDYAEDDYMTFRVELDWIAPATRQCGQRLICGDYVSGELLSDLSVDVYFFDGKAQDKFNIETSHDAGELGFSPRVLAYDPDGVLIAVITEHTRTMALPSDGSYTLLVMNSIGYVPHVGKYRLRLRQVFPTAEACVPVLTCGVPVRGSTLWDAGEEFFAFDAEAGDRIRIEVANGPGRDPAWTGGGEWTGPYVALRGPDFNGVGFNFGLPFTLPLNGRYLLRVLDTGYRGSGPGSFTVTVRWEEPTAKRCDDACPTPVTAGCTALTVRAIDANQPGLRDSFADPFLLLAGGRAVEGAAADGVTPVLLVAEGLTGPGTVTFVLQDECSGSSAAAVGTLHEPRSGAVGIPLVVDAIQDPLTAEWKAFAVWTTPLDFARGDVDRTAAFREVHVGASTAAGCGFEDLLLVRPPVLLVHGLWGSGDAWDLRTLPIRNAARYLIDGRTMPEYVYIHDYRLTNGDPLATNVPRVRKAIDSALHSFRGVDASRDVPLACTQVDLVTHSMGSVIARLFIANASGDYSRDDNFLRGDVHKFIPIAGPHFGSPWADAMDQVMSVPGLGDLAILLFELGGMCLDCGAVQDLQLDQLDAMPAARIRTHAIYGTGASDYIEAGTLVPPRVFDDAVTGLTSLLAWMRKKSSLDLSAILFGDEAHDMLVAENIARSGLPDSKVTGFGFIDGIHTYMHKSWRVEERVTELLDDSLVAPNGPFAQSLPGAGALPVTWGSPSEGDRPEVAPPSFAILEGLLRLTSPMLDGLEAGDAIAVEIFPVTGFVPDGVVVFGGAGGIEILTKPPFRTVVEIPSTAENRHALVAVGWSGNAMAVSGQLLVRLDGSAVPERVHASPDPLFLFSYSSCEQIAVQARYADFSLRNVSPDDEGLSFVSLDPSVAFSDGLGNVCARGNGRTSVVVSYDGRTTEVPVLVDLTPTDDRRALASRRQCGSNLGGLDVSGPHGGRPVLGSSLVFHLDPAAAGYAQGVILGYALSDQRTVLGGQTLCLDTASARYFLAPVNGASNSVTVPVPSSLSFVGRTFSAQGMLSGPLLGGLPPARLLNAWDFRVGTH